MSTGFEVFLRGGVDAPGLARRAIAANDLALPPSVQGDIALLVSELVTNAVRHGGAATDRPLQVSFRRQASRIRVEVVDPGTGFEAPAPPVAERWGVGLAPAGSRVWFELPVGLTA